MLIIGKVMLLVFKLRILNNLVNQGFVEVFQITPSGIVKYTKGGNAFSKNDGEQNVIRPHTDSYKLDDSQFWIRV